AYCLRKLVDWLVRQRWLLIYTESSSAVVPAALPGLWDHQGMTPARTELRAGVIPADPGGAPEWAGLRATTDEEVGRERGRRDLWPQEALLAVRRLRRVGRAGGG